MTFLSNLEWRYSTKKFDTTKKVSEEHVSQILEAMRMAPTSFGLQPFHFFVIENQEKKDAIQAAAHNQTQVGTSSHLLVMCSRSDLSQLKDEYFEGLSGGDAEKRAKMKGYEDMIAGFIPYASPEWSKKQTYIALGFAIAAATELQIDSSPMEGFDAAAVGKILELPETMQVAVLLPIGYRAPDDNPKPKFRFAKEKLFTELK